MGMFDSIFFKCPNCGKTIEAQSKSGPCVLNSFKDNNAPVIVAAGVLNEVLKCYGCNKNYQVKTQWCFLPLFLDESIEKHDY